MRTLRRAIWLLLPLLVVGTSLALTASSEEMRAGVVTGLQGTASVSRASLNRPQALRFKDDIYLRDQIVTGDASIARILLGGKALLTVRERSMVRITEAPGVSTVSVTSGRAAVNVLKERMQPGDSVEIVTPNATAAIRGTIVVAEVEADDAGTRSTITVLRGLIDVTQHDASGQAIGRPVSVSALQQVTAVAARLSPVRQITQQAADRLANDFKMAPRAAPVSASVVQSEVDRAMQQVARDTGVKNGDRSADSKKGDTAPAADSGKDGDSAKGGDKTAGGNGGSDRVGGGGGDRAGDRGGDRGGDRLARGGDAGGNVGGGSDRDRGDRGDRDRGDRGDRGDRDRGNKGSGKKK
jgi:FecR protein